jgi:hypothetical protein
MARALATRDENWKRLKQYILDEHEELDARDPSGAPLFGRRGEYSWFIRDGYFIRSPIRVDGITIGEDERRRAEGRWLEREKAREARQAKEKEKPGGPLPAAPVDLPPPGDMGAFLRQTIEPRFISTAYFLDFKFEPGNYFLAGRETVEGREVLRVEYYPTKLFADEDEGRRPERQTRGERRDREAEMERKMNKVSLVTLWVEPASAQIIKYTFSNVGTEFLPLRWFVRLDDLSATMVMGQPFPDVWLPRSIDIRVALTIATGTYEMRYTVRFVDYRQADVKAKIRTDPRELR